MDFSNMSINTRSHFIHKEKSNIIKLKYNMNQDISDEKHIRISLLSFPMLLFIGFKDAIIVTFKNALLSNSKK